MLSLRMALRELRAGDTATLLAALAIAAMALCSVEAFTERLDRVFTERGAELLGGDLALAAREELPEPLRRANPPLRAAEHFTFPSVVFAGERSALAAVKAVSRNYPLYGSVDVSKASPTSVTGTPEQGSVWLDPQLSAALDVTIGSHIELGAMEFVVAGEILFEPDSGGGMQTLGPRLMMSVEDLGTAELIGAGSRFRHTVMYAGPATAIAQLRRDLAAELAPGQAFVTVEDTQRQLAEALTRAQQFLRMAALTAILLAAIAVALSVQHFAARQVDTAALLRTLGMSGLGSAMLLSASLLSAALPAIAVGIAGGYLLQGALPSALGSLAPQDLPAAGMAPGLYTALVLFTVLAGFAIPPLLALRRTPPMRVLAHQLDQTHANWWGPLLVAALSLGGVTLLMLQDLILAGSALGIALATAAILGAAAIALIRLAPALYRGKGLLGSRLKSLRRQPLTVGLQVGGLGLGLAAVLALAVIQRDLLASWETSLPSEAPTAYLLNVQPDQQRKTEDFFTTRNIDTAGLFPMAVSRLTAINGVPVDEIDFANPEARRRSGSNVNLSWARQLPPGSKVTMGQWGPDETGAPWAAVSEWWASIFGIEVGDKLQFRAGAQQTEVRVTSLREVDWDSFEVNFFVLIDPDALHDVPVSYLASVRTPDGDTSGLIELVRQLPNISLINIADVVERVRRVVERASLAVTFIFLFTVCAGVVLLAAAVLLSQRERMFEASLSRVFGATGAELRRSSFLEFAGVGAAAGLIASLAALLGGYVLARFVFEIEYHPSWWLPPVASLAGALLALLPSLLVTRRILQATPVSLLRRF